MAIKVYGHKLSLCTRRVLLVLAEKGQDFELKPVDFITGEHKRLPYAEKHPFQVIPALDDDGFALYESRAICRYLAAKLKGQGTPLIPENVDIKACALFEQFASVEYSQFYNIAEQVLVQKMFNPAKGLPSDEVAAATSTKLLNEKLAILDRMLANHQYMAGSHFSLVDIFYMPVVEYLHAAGVTFEGNRNIEKWWDRVSQRKSWKDIITL